MAGNGAWRVTDHRFAAAMQVLTGLEQAGWQAYLVGGCVRDMLLGKKPQDYDVATDALPEQVQRLFPRTVPTGIRHGTVSVLIGDERIEVTTFRTEGPYLDARRPSEVRFVCSLEQDLARRDFTINAMAMDGRGQLYDPYGGRHDLQKRRIRAVGDPEQRFSEDALRMLRAIRFAAVFQGRIERRTWQAIRRSAGRLALIARERIRDEWNKILLADVALGVRYLTESGLLPAVYPDLAGMAVASWREAADFVNRLPEKGNLRQAALFWQLQVDEATAQASLRRLRQPNGSVRAVAAILRAIPGTDPLSWPAETWRRYLYRHGAQAAADAMEIVGEARQSDKGQLAGRLREAIERQPIWSVRDLAVNGEDLIRRLQVPAGPLVGKMLEELAELVLDHPDRNTRPQLLAAAAKRYRQRKNGWQEGMDR